MFNDTIARAITMADLLRLGRIVDAAQKGHKVAFLADNGEVLYGIARHLVTDEERAGFPGRNDNLFGCFLRITMLSGFERFEPIATLIELLGESFFVDVL